MAEMTVEQQRALAIARARRRRAEAAPEVSRTEATLSGFGRGLKTATENIQSVDPLSLLMGATGFGAEGRKALSARTAAIARQAQQSRPNYFAGGKIAGEIAPTIPVMGLGGAAVRGLGGGLARVAPRLGPVVERIGTAMQTGGIGAGRTAAESAKLTARARQGQLVERVIGGAAGGATGAALTDQDVTEGAKYGGGLPVIASVLKRGGGFVADLAKLPALKAADIVRKSLGENVDAARAAFAALPADSRELARQTLVRLGIEPRVFMAVAEGAERLRPDEVAAILDPQVAARKARLAGAAGGGTMEEVRAATRAGRAGVSKEFTPVREAAFGKLSDVSDAEVLAREARRRAAEASALASGQEDMSRRLTGAASLFEDSPMFIKGAEAATGRAEAAGTEAAAQRATADQMEDYVYQAAAEGLQPQNAAPIIASFRNMATQPGTRVDDLQRDTLLGIANKIENAVDANGMINPYDLYQIRKTGINDFIGGLEAKITAGTAPKSGNLQRTEQLALSMRNQIDKMLGPEVQKYLADSAKGYAAVNRGELAGEALRLYKQEPKAATEFRALVGGDRPETVRDIMKGGPENESFVGAFADDPARLNAMQQTAREIKNLNRMSTLTGEGRTAANELIGRERPMFARAATRFGLSAFPPARVAAEAAQTALTGALAPRVQQQLATGALSGRNMLALMNQYPTSVRASEMISQLSPETRNALAQLVRSGTFTLNQPPE